MKTLLKYSLPLFFTFMLLITAMPEASAQCAMCRATVENNISSGESSVGAGLNTGIIYLMLMPYMLFAVVAYAWYRYSKKESTEKKRLQQLLRSKMNL